MPGMLWCAAGSLHVALLRLSYLCQLVAKIQQSTVNYGDSVFFSEIVLLEFEQIGENSLLYKGSSHSRAILAV